MLSECGTGFDFQGSRVCSIDFSKNLIYTRMTVLTVKEAFRMLDDNHGIHANESKRVAKAPRSPVPANEC